MAVLLLASSLTNGDVSHTVKGVHKHTFLVYTESKDKKRRRPPDSGWPNTGHEVIRWPFFTLEMTTKLAQHSFRGSDSLA
ncbi:hypothetical protein CEXT_134131 [Caerostris extrusa]|uniref:Secreted protein n=1 Tax=Caerostris extrusa TaxID=172846 RepID=A0AAV4NAY0_CAEEX|nr:hypothetical protein CEXT_134131 [Caerostris extrusa]